jgi:hypothetical protein
MIKLEEYQQGMTTWKKEYKSIQYKITHHGISDYSPYGTWCYYILIAPLIFVNPEDFESFNMKKKKSVFPGSEEKKFYYYDYSKLPNLKFHGGCTYYDKKEELDHSTGKMMKYFEIGCDYNHYYEDEYRASYHVNWIDTDAKTSIDCLTSRFKTKIRCKYSGIWDIEENFYLAKNNCMVHNSQLEILKQSNEAWTEYWLPPVEELFINDSEIQS